MANALVAFLTALVACLPLACGLADAEGLDGIDLTLWDIRREREAPLASAAHDLAKADVLLVGESHGNPSHHKAQLEIIRALSLSGRPVAVGLEMFQQRDQGVLDAWIAGEISEQELRQAFARNWDEALWSVYKPIFEYARREKLPMVGLNVPREITRQVARQGFSSLSREQLGQLPPVVCIVAPEYETFLRRVLGEHAAGSEFQRFCEAQLVWDTAMAYHAGEFRKANPGLTLVVLTGTVHAWMPAMPAQLRKLHPELSSLSVLPGSPHGLDNDEVTSEDADYLYLGQGAD